MLYESQIKGLVAICLILAIIPFFNFFYRSFFSYKTPIFTDQFEDSLAVEVVDGDWNKGIYFVSPDTTVNNLFQSIGTEKLLSNDIQLKNGMKILIKSVLGKDDIIAEKIEADKKLALGMRLNINEVTEDELLFINGIGGVTAKKILDLRTKLGRFRNIEQLMEIKGIKEKKLAKLRQFLYVRNNEEQIYCLLKD